MATNMYEDRILRVLTLSFRQLNTKEVAHYAQVDYSTADKYLKLLLRKGLVRHSTSGNTNYWRIKGMF